MALLLRVLLIFLLLRTLYVLLFKKRIVRKRASETTQDFHGKDPYDSLGVTRKSSAEEIKKAYHKALAEYHPDKVDHLGEDLQLLAKQKTAEIIKAYKAIR